MQRKHAAQERLRVYGRLLGVCARAALQANAVWIALIL